MRVRHARRDPLLLALRAGGTECGLAGLLALAMLASGAPAAPTLAVAAALFVAAAWGARAGRAWARRGSGGLGHAFTFGAALVCVSTVVSLALLKRLDGLVEAAAFALAASALVLGTCILVLHGRRAVRAPVWA
ncbi:MAG TPA: hypothetical protein VFH47_06595 [Candidatus Thermoplasmatota archaeon]|nr:hypothetical protein [Candidatus Thermoplasmatota archaeon]